MLFRSGSRVAIGAIGNDGNTGTTNDNRGHVRVYEVPRLALANDGADVLNIKANGPFTFTSPLFDGDPYIVTVEGQPRQPSQTCEVSNGVGLINGADVDNVLVNCTLDTFTVGGTVSGLTGSGLVLQNNGGDDLAVSQDGAFEFATALEDFSSYKVTVYSQAREPAQVCSVTNGNGALDGADVVNVQINCVDGALFTIGGFLTGLEGSGLALQLTSDGGNEQLALSADGIYVFNSLLSDQANYSVAVSAVPTSPWQTCTVSNPGGSVNDANVWDVNVDCTVDRHTIGGTLSGLAGSGLRLTNNGGNSLSLNADGAFVFAGDLASGESYDVAVASQPTNLSQTCTLTGGSGVITNADIDITVTCVTNTYTIGGRVTGLLDSGLILQLNGDEFEPFTEDRRYIFDTRLEDGSAYEVLIVTPPNEPQLVCTVSNGSGVLAGADVTNANVLCLDPSVQIFFDGFE